VDAALVITNADRQRLCETETGQCYGRWNVSANSNNLGNGEVSGTRRIGPLARGIPRDHHRTIKS